MNGQRHWPAPGRGLHVLRTVVVWMVVGQVGAAHAHLVSTELGPFYDGVAHPLVSPQDLLTIIGLAILAAFGGTISGRRLVASLSLAWATGVVAGFVLRNEPLDLPLATAGVILLLGVTGLLKLRIPSLVLAPAAIVIGLARGVMNGAAARAADGTWLSIFGVAVGVFVLGVLMAGLGAWLVRRRVEIALRVVGSWIAAISLLMLGWTLRA